VSRKRFCTPVPQLPLPPLDIIGSILNIHHELIKCDDLVLNIIRVQSKLCQHSDCIKIISNPDNLKNYTKLAGLYLSDISNPQKIASLTRIFFILSNVEAVQIDLASIMVCYVSKLSYMVEQFSSNPPLEDLFVKVCLVNGRLSG
jgi:hypothetical protein